MSKMGCSWSGGKDSCYALMLAIQQDFQLKVLVNMMNENGRISRSHGLPQPILQQQADAMDVPLIAIPTSWNDYEVNFVNTLHRLKREHQVNTMVFGDIDLQPHRDWEENVCSQAGLNAFLPLWQRDRRVLVHDMLNAGIKTLIVSCNLQMGEKYLGRYLDEKIVEELDSIGVDVCGENGEFHTLVVDCPLFKRKINLPDYTTVQHEDYWFLQWPNS